MTVTDLTRSLDWLARAACAGRDDWTEHTDAAGARDRIRICQGCPVIDACTGHAIATEQTHYVVAGVKLPRHADPARRALQQAAAARQAARETETAVRARTILTAVAAVPRRAGTNLTGAEKVEIQRLRYAEGMKVRQIAARLGVSASAVSQIAPKRAEVR